MGHSHNWLWNIFSDISVIVMVLITLRAMIRHFNHRHSASESDVMQEGDLSLIIKGMTCNHCKQTATEVIKGCDGVNEVTINLESGKTVIDGNAINEEQIISAITSVGFSVSKFS